MKITESRLHNLINNAINEIIKEDYDNVIETHFAVNKKTNLIVNGWDYSDEDPEELRRYKNDFFFNDLRDNGYNTKDYKILGRNTLIKRGIDPADQRNWSNDGLTSVVKESKSSSRLSDNKFNALLENTVRNILREAKSDTYVKIICDFNDVIDGLNGDYSFSEDELSEIYDILRQNDDIMFSYDVSVNVNEEEPSNYDYPGYEAYTDNIRATFLGISDASKEELGEEATEEVYNMADLFTETDAFHELINDKTINNI